MIRLLSENSLRSLVQTEGIAQAAAIAARTDQLDDGLRRLLPVIGAWSLAERVTAMRIVAGAEPSLLAHWPQELAKCSPPLPSELNDARCNEGAVVIGTRAVLIARSGGESIALVVEGHRRSSIEGLAYQYQLIRMTRQIETLMERSRHIQHLETLGRTDSLTGLPNRRALEETLVHYCASTSGTDRSLSLALLDLDDFKHFNDTLGHPAGDWLLKAFAERLRKGLRRDDFVCRYGGEEFCVVLPSASGEQAQAVLADIRARLHAETDVSFPAFSAGIATWHYPEPAERLLARADEALYQAKAGGKDQSVIADQPPAPGS